MRAVGEGGVEDAALAITPDPGEGVVVVGAEALVLVLRQVGGEIGLRRVDSQQDANVLPRVGIVEAEDLVGPWVGLSFEAAEQRMGGIVEIHHDGLLDVSAAVPRAARADHVTELRPVLQRRPLPFGEGHGGAVDAHQPAAGGDEFEQVLAALRFGHGGADGVVEEDGVEGAERLAIENGGVLADDRFEGSGPLSELLEGLAAREDGGAVAVVLDVAVEDQEAAGLGRLGAGLGGHRLLDALPLRGVGDEAVGGMGASEQEKGPRQSEAEGWRDEMNEHFNEYV